MIRNSHSSKLLYSFLEFITQGLRTTRQHIGNKCLLRLGLKLYVIHECKYKGWEHKQKTKICLKKQLFNLLFQCYPTIVWQKRFKHINFIEFYLTEKVHVWKYKDYKWTTKCFGFFLGFNTEKLIHPYIVKGNCLVLLYFNIMELCAIYGNLSLLKWERRRISQSKTT